VSVGGCQLVGSLGSHKLTLEMIHTSSVFQLGGHYFLSICTTLKVDIDPV
jgi:hypothetical protein